MLLALLLDPLANPLAASPVPLARGTYWEYRESYTEAHGEVDATTDGTTRFEVRGRADRPYIYQEGGADPSPGPVEAGDGWIRLTPWTGEDALPLPLLPGRTGPRTEGGFAWTVEAEEDVEVPAGTFRSLRCALRGPGSESVLWIAPGVGVVRETQGSGRSGRRPEIERVLLKWALARTVHEARTTLLMNRPTSLATQPLSRQRGVARTPSLTVLLFLEGLRGRWTAQIGSFTRRARRPPG